MVMGHALRFCFYCDRTCIPARVCHPRHSDVLLTAALAQKRETSLVHVSLFSSCQGLRALSSRFLTRSSRLLMSAISWKPSSPRFLPPDFGCRTFCLACGPPHSETNLGFLKSTPLHITVGFAPASELAVLTCVFAAASLMLTAQAIMFNRAGCSWHNQQAPRFQGLQTYLLSPLISRPSDTSLPHTHLFLSCFLLLQMGSSPSPSLGWAWETSASLPFPEDQCRPPS